MRSKDMLKVSVFALNSDREKVINILHRQGAMQLLDLKTSNILQSANPTEEIKEVSDYLIRMSHIIDILKIPPIKIPFTQSLLGLEFLEKYKIKQFTKQTLLDEVKAFMDKHEQTLLNLENEHNTNTELLEELRAQKLLFKLFQELNLPINHLQDTKHTNVTVGRLPIQKLPILKKELESETNNLIDFHYTKENKKDAIILTVSLKEQHEKVSYIIKKHGLNILAVPISPDNPRNYILDQIKKSKDKILKARKEIRDIKEKIHTKAVIYREELDIAKEKHEAIHKFVESKNFFILQGWVPKENITKLEHQLPFAAIEKEAAKKEENPPVKLNNKSWLKPFEMLTELYSTPNYKDLDPTFVVGPIFLLFAGFMLTDFVYGLGLVLLGTFLIKKFAKYSKGLKDISINIIGIGAVSMVFGVLTGSYLGDAPFYFFGPEYTTAKLLIWKDPLADPLYFLIMAICVAVVHVNLGLILGSIEDIKSKLYKQFAKDRLVWFMLQFSILSLILDFSFKVPLTILTFILIVALRGPLGLLNTTGFLGDMISYSRLFALALSTAGIAMTVNLLSNLLWPLPYGIGPISATIIFVIGHLFSFLMNSLGSFVHSIRLQFVEFFGKFYEGGGEKFTPFKEERLYTEVKKDDS